jgi:hypothetical protein
MIILKFKYTIKTKTPQNMNFEEFNFLFFKESI